MRDGQLEESNDGARPSPSRLMILKSWLDTNDVQLSSKLAIRAMPSDADDETASRKQDVNYGIYALQAIDQDEILSVIPRAAILSKRTTSLAREPSFLDFCDTVKAATPLQAEVRILATVLTHEIQLGSHSRRHGYMQTMPQSYQELGLPMFWDNEQALHWLEGTDAVHYMEKQKCTKHDVEAFFNDLVDPFLSSSTSKPVEYTTFKLAFSLVLSRAFYVDNFHGLSMVPLADVFNHHYLPHATLQSDDIVCPTCGARIECEHDDAQAKPSDHYDTQSRVGTSASLEQSTATMTLAQADLPEVDAVEMVATTTVEEEEEVFNTYGRLDNAALLVNYGFMLEANEDDKVRWFTVRSVLEQAGIAATNDQDEVENRWMSCIKSGELEQDGNVSRYLWLLLSIASQHHNLEKQNTDSVPPDYVEIVIQARLKQLMGQSEDIDDLFRLLNQAQDKDERALQLALSRVIGERLLLSACLAQWQQDDDSLDISE